MRPRADDAAAHRRARPAGSRRGGLIPLALTVSGDLYSMEERARIQGLFSSIWGVSSLVGPLAGAFLTMTAGWRSIFLLNLPLGVLAAWIVATRMIETPRARARGAGAAGRSSRCSGAGSDGVALRVGGAHGDRAVRRLDVRPSLRAGRARRHGRLGRRGRHAAHPVLGRVRDGGRPAHPARRVPAVGASSAGRSSSSGSRGFSRRWRSTPRRRGSARRAPSSGAGSGRRRSPSSSPCRRTRPPSSAASRRASSRSSGRSEGRSASPRWAASSRPACRRASGRRSSPRAGRCPARLPRPRSSGSRSSTRSFRSSRAPRGVRPRGLRRGAIPRGPAPAGWSGGRGLIGGRLLGENTSLS